MFSYGDERTFQDDGKCFSQHFFFISISYLIYFSFLFCICFLSFAFLCVCVFILLVGNETFNCSTENGKNRYSKKNIIKRSFFHLFLHSFLHYFLQFFLLKVIVDTMNVMLSKANFVYFFIYIF